MGDMDSGNSGSIQSSSTGGGVGGVGGGDEQEFESHGGGGETSSFPASFFNNPSVNYQVAPMDNARLLQLYSLNNNGSSSSLNNIFDHHQQHGHVHFGSLDSANFNTGKFIAHETNNLDSIMWANKFAPISTHGYNNNNIHQPQLGPAPPSENSTRSTNLNGSGGSGGPCRNPKKRSRASRRAPTTVLTTDTSNFRQMVQEFTGIPSPPFSSFPTRSRLDLFSGMGTGTGMGSALGLGPSSYLLRPFAQKIAPPNNGPMLSFQSLLQQSSSLIQDSSKGSAGSDPDNWGGLHQGLGLTQVGSLSVPAVTDAANNTERVDVINSSTSENHGGGGGMVADSWICSSD